jgi:hypothetical protein
VLAADQQRGALIVGRAQAVLRRVDCCQHRKARVSGKRPLASDANARASRRKVTMMATTPLSREGESTRSASTPPSRLAFLLLRTVFTVAPIAFGLDKFANVLTHWPDYLAPWVDDLVPGTAQQAMYAVGVVEIVAGLVVAMLPRYGGLLVAAWLAGIIVNLLTIPDYYDVALRDFGLLVAALALSLLAVEHDARTLRSLTRR